jgi:hypothetical protein
MAKTTRIKAGAEEGAIRVEGHRARGVAQGAGARPGEGSGWRTRRRPPRSPGRQGEGFAVSVVSRRTWRRRSPHRRASSRRASASAVAAYPMAAGAEFGGRGGSTTQQFQPWRGTRATSCSRPSAARGLRSPRSTSRRSTSRREVGLRVTGPRQPHRPPGAARTEGHRGSKKRAQAAMDAETFGIRVDGVDYIINPNDMTGSVERKIRRRSIGRSFAQLQVAFEREMGIDLLGELMWAIRFANGSATCCWTTSSTRCPTELRGGDQGPGAGPKSLRQRLLPEPAALSEFYGLTPDIDGDPEHDAAGDPGVPHPARRAPTRAPTDRRRGSMALGGEARKILVEFLGDSRELVAASREAEAALTGFGTQGADRREDRREGAGRRAADRGRRHVRGDQGCGRGRGCAGPARAAAEEQHSRDRTSRSTR